jgi:hypothetical protein
MAQSLSVLRAEVTGDRAYPRALARGTHPHGAGQDLAARESVGDASSGAV